VLGQDQRLQAVDASGDEDTSPHEDEDACDSREANA
jgi:hypothetical protein